MKTPAIIAALSLCLATTAHAQMTQSQSDAAQATLNSQQATAAQQQQDQNVANQNEHDAAVADRNQTIQNNNMAYGAAMHEHHRTVREYHQAMREWRADVAACNAGDRSRCDHSRPER